MKKVYFAVCSAVFAALFAGCSSTPPVPAAPVVSAEPVVVAEAVPPPPVPAEPVLLNEMQKSVLDITAAGGLAALGTSESKSLDLALNRAKANGRIRLAQILGDRVEALAKSFSEETGIAYESLLLSGFNNTEKTLSRQIASSLAQSLKYETVGDEFAAYAVMVLDPQAIVDELKKETDLYTRLQPTKAFDAFLTEINSYATFKAAKGL